MAGVQSVLKIRDCFRGITLKIATYDGKVMNKFKFA